MVLYAVLRNHDEIEAFQQVFCQGGLNFVVPDEFY
jgi:hypothetical protein